MQGKRQKLKIAVDAVLAAAMPILMAEILTGQEFHEWLGIGITACFILHHVLNRKWLAGIFRGKYSRVRIALTAVNALLFVCIIVLCLSGISMSGYALASLKLPLSRTVVRVLHISFAWWGFILMSVHLGFHWGRAVKAFADFCKKDCLKRIRKYLPKVVCAALAFLGIISAARLEIWNYLFFRTGFAYFTDAHAPLLYLGEMLSTMIFFAALGYYYMMILKKGKC